MSTAKNTSITLGKHFDEFIATQIEAGRFSTASEVVREGLRVLEDRETKLDILRKKLAIGEEQVNNAEFADYSYDALMQELDQE